MNLDKLRIALVSGFWGQNIGNAFFNIGGKWILEQVLPEAQVNFVLDQPGYRTFHKQHTGNPPNDWGMLQFLDVDVIVLQGPMLTTAFPALWESTLTALCARGTKVVLLGAAMFRFSEEEISVNRAFLKKIQPIILSTRDVPTYEAFKDLVPHAHPGVDSAFFTPDAYQPFALKADPYICVNFDRWLEPRITIGDSKVTSPSDKTFIFDDRCWSLNFPSYLMKMADKNKIQSYLAAALDFRKLPDHIADYQIVRPEHRFNPHITWKIYRRANAVASDEPWTYFTIYSNTSFTLSDRVHACIISLAYGKPAMLFSPSPRSQLFDHLNLEGIREKPTSLDPSLLKEKKKNQLEFLKSAFAESLQ